MLQAFKVAKQRVLDAYWNSSSTSAVDPERVAKFRSDLRAARERMRIVSLRMKRNFVANFAKAEAMRTGKAGQILRMHLLSASGQQTDNSNTTIPASGNHDSLGFLGNSQASSPRSSVVPATRQPASNLCTGFSVGAERAAGYTARLANAFFRVGRSSFHKLVRAEGRGTETCLSKSAQQKVSELKRALVDENVYLTERLTEVRDRALDYQNFLGSFGGSGVVRDVRLESLGEMETAIATILSFLGEVKLK